MTENQDLGYTINTEINFFAAANFRNQQRKFGIKRDDRRRHMYLIGKTGMGKSNAIENMVINDIRAGHGLAVIDPHGDTVEKVMDYVPKSRINDVVFFNPYDDEYPIAFNVLESVNPKYKNLVASGLIGVFKKMWADSWGPRLEYILINTILGLLEYQGSTLLGVTRMLVDKGYRKKVVDQITDPIVKAFWINEYANYNERFRSEAISPIQNKVGQFLSSPIIRNIVGQPKSTMDIREIMDQKKVLLMNLSKGRIGEENSALLGAMMITRLQIAAMSRVDITEDERQDFYLYVDEFQNFSTDSFADILSEARKYRLNLIIAHQYIEQLGEKVQAAVFGNVGTIVAFRVGAADAEYLEKEFTPYFDETDLVNLPKYEIYLKLMIDGVASQPFSAQTLPPVEGEAGAKETVIKNSRERYANNREEVEARIMKWSGMDEMSKSSYEEGGEDRSRGPARRNNNQGGNRYQGQQGNPRQQNYNPRDNRQSGGGAGQGNNRPQEPREESVQEELIEAKQASRTNTLLGGNLPKPKIQRPSSQNQSRPSQPRSVARVNKPKIVTKFSEEIVKPRKEQNQEAQAPAVTTKEQNTQKEGSKGMDFLKGFD